MKQYVQHISGQGEKWEVVHNDSDPFMWIAKSPEECRNNFLLPKTEYHLCEPPEEWDDVTENCVIGYNELEQDNGRNNILFKHPGSGVWIDILNGCLKNQYRVRKINHLHNGPCFIVERKKS